MKLGYQIVAESACVEYSIAAACAEALSKLEGTVREYIKLGWLPQGGVSVSVDQPGSVYVTAVACQAMIFNKTEDEV